MLRAATAAARRLLPSGTLRLCHFPCASFSTAAPPPVELPQTSPSQPPPPPPPLVPRPQKQGSTAAALEQESYELASATAAAVEVEVAAAAEDLRRKQCSRAKGGDYEDEQAPLLKSALGHVKLGCSESELMAGARDVDLSPSIVASFRRKEATLVEDTLFDEFVPAHIFGWWGRAIMIRNQPLLWVLSIGFELMELTFWHMLPNFNECWWDSIILDILIYNWFDGTSPNFKSQQSTFSMTDYTPDNISLQSEESCSSTAGHFAVLDHVACLTSLRLLKREDISQEQPYSKEFEKVLAESTDLYSKQEKSKCKTQELCGSSEVRNISTLSRISLAPNDVPTCVQGVRNQL